MKKTTDELLKEMQTSDNAERFIKDNPEDIIFNGMEELFDYHIKTKGLKKGGGLRRRDDRPKLRPPNYKRNPRSYEG